MKVTPGPWRVVHYTDHPEDAFHIYTDTGGPDALIADSIEPVHQPRTALANARLMAASPHMHEALTAAENALAIAASYRDVTRAPDGDRINAALTTARRALAKARGEP